MTSALISIKRRCPLVWRAVERVNGWLFSLRFPDFGRIMADVLKNFRSDDFIFSPVAEEDIPALSDFLCGQPAERTEYFKPHDFDAETLTRMYRGGAFGMMKITEKAGGRFAGYFFLRCFFIGRAFHGLIAAECFAGRGLGTAMWALSSKICSLCGLRMFATVSEKNAASLVSARKATDVTVVEKLADGYLLVECKPLCDND